MNTTDSTRRRRALLLALGASLALALAAFLSPLERTGRAGSDPARVSVGPGARGQASGAAEPVDPRRATAGDSAEAGPMPTSGRVPAAEPDTRWTLEGRVVDAANGRAVTAFRILAAPRGERARLREALDDPARLAVRRSGDGSFRFEDLSPGRWSVLVDPREAGYEPVLLDDVLLRSDEAVEVAVERGLHVHGRLRTEDGRLLPGRTVALERLSAVDPAPGKRTPVSAGAAPNEVRRVRTGEDGGFVFGRLEPGTYRLAVADGPAVAWEPFRVAGHQGTEHDLVVPTGATLHVAAVDPAGTPLTAPTLLVARAGEFHDVAAHSPGELLLAGLVPDRYALEVRHPGFLPAHHSVTLADGGRADLTVVLERAR